MTEIIEWGNFGVYGLLQGVWLKLIVHEVFLAGLPGEDIQSLENLQ